MTDTPAPSVPTSPPAGPAVSPEIDALIDEIEKAVIHREVVSGESTTVERQAWANDAVAAARAALREAFARLQANWDFASQSWTKEVDVLNETVAALSEERDMLIIERDDALELGSELNQLALRLQQEALTDAEVRAIMDFYDTGNDSARISRAFAKLRRRSAEKTQE